MSEPRYNEQLTVCLDCGAVNDKLAICLDCGAVIADQTAHTRFHSILSGHAWAIACLQTAHINAATHGRYQVYQRIKSKQFESWSNDALAEVARSLAPEPQEDEDEE